MEKHPASSQAPGMRPALSLFLLGFLTLFLELALIRYLAGNIWNLGFFPNIVLMGTFVGMGTGFVTHHLIPERSSAWLFSLAPALLALLVLFVTLFHPSLPGFGPDAGEVGGEVFFTGISEAATESSYLLFALWLLLIVGIFALISQYTAKLFGRFAPLHAYTLDIGGSCAGIVSFMLMSWLQVPAAFWFLLAIPLVVLAPLPFSGRRAALGSGLLLACSAVAIHQDGQLLTDPDYADELEVRWSPYQKVELTLGEDRDPFVYVNGIRHQGMHTTDVLQQHFYNSPYAYREEHDGPPYERVLVIGAGSGNDVAAALAAGAKHVDAVEIDPVIAQMGRDHHPAQPYSDERVTVHVDDGRAFLTRSEEKYDLIIFALTDSLVKVSPMAQLRLENYLFTVESYARAFSRLEDDGVLALYNFYREPFVIDKLQDGLRIASGREPEQLAAWHSGFAVVVVDKGLAPQAAAVDPAVQPAVDDWPFPYLERRSVPEVYRYAMLALLAYVTVLFVVIPGDAGMRGQRRPGSVALRAAFALMGAAFLLLETKSVIQFSLLFGTTWVNSSLVFLGVLLLVLAANFLASRVRSRWLTRLVLPLLLGSCLLPLAFPLANLLYVENEGLRFVAASLLTFSPVFFANLLFSIEFRDQKVAENIFGWNLLGSTLGGVLEYASMTLGYGVLALVVALFYAVAFGLFSLSARATAHPGTSPE